MNKREGILGGRIVCFDLIRFFSCLCIAIIHFNATVSGWNGVFVYPNSLTPNYVFANRVTIGDLGVSLFFMLSGATLMYTYRGGVLNFYKKRIRNIYPMFWLAFGIVTILDFLYYKGMTGDSPRYLLFSILGMDGYLGSMGYIPMGYYKVGEWFLGCIVLLYLVFPLVHAALEKQEVLTCAVIFCGFAAISVLRPGLNPRIFFLRIPEMLLGMLFVKHRLYEKPLIPLAIGAGIFAAAFLLQGKITSLMLCVASACLAFGVLTFAAQFITSEKLAGLLKKAADLTYPIFLIHHWLNYRLIKGFDLAAVHKRDVLMLFFLYVLFTVILSYGLIALTKKVEKACKI